MSASLAGNLIRTRRGLLMWTTKNRAKYNRDRLRYPSDLTDEEWGHIESLIPPSVAGASER
jgi:putative transposase